MNKKLDRNGILDIIPHRFENILLDSISITGAGEEDRAGVGSLCFGEDDADGRNIFLLSEPDGTCVYSPFMLMEFCALGAITLMEEKIKAGLTAVFSSIRKVQVSSHIPAGGQLTHEITLKSISSGFHRFDATVKSGSTEACSLEIMAYGVDMKDELPSDRPSTKRIIIPEEKISEPVDKSAFSFKSPDMIFAEKTVDFSQEAKTLAVSYTYPDTHPLTKGHFPGNPVMMGVTQVMMLCDAAQLLAEKLGREGESLTANGVIMRDDGSVVCEMKGLTFSYSGPGRYPPLQALKTVAFRDIVKPGEPLYAKVESRG